ncbi:MAG: type II toxin-antitoxin system Phd/YefM family antitoxin [Spirochaetales bacterium]|nr:type II toxin-antitoxin system Phd/YefM family antitoxin [Spirochaetales bacterium]
MISVNIHDAKTHFSAIIRAIEQNGEKVIIMRHGIAVAEINPVPHGKRTAVHSELCNIEIKYDPTEPTEEEWGDV